MAMIRVDKKTLNKLKRMAKKESKPGRNVTIGGVVARLVEEAK